ncbi:hypothetical protein FN846DRAFT_922098 [Sphaerosporella brunnea]|uniref:Peptide hydrolase n=1 Tax=Sphaerosporella brunnea TaxID=1250544 RepID=A0A5J5EKY9_9PEZI|nr:hypothetical protein FN846DRAFT_922098 [Sphaerosporella brunnea]
MNPKTILAFRPLSVTLLTVATYIAILGVLLYIHLVPPPVASRGELDSWGVDFDAAWQDLRVLTAEFRPYNARRNDDVRDYLLNRIEDIVKRNIDRGYKGVVRVVDDNETNITFTDERLNGLTVYFEGTNIIVYVVGTNPGLSPVLVNAHYDSVSTGYGATDDGMATVSVLQVIQAFTNPDRKQIQRGLIALLNNGEEDYLNGARAWAAHPLSNLSHTFLNLEGAGAGGRATLFRSTDAEVTKWYKHSKHPFGCVASGDGFKKGLVKSQTDYKVFTENLGMRGLDVAFWEPRSRYHTQDDDAKHTSKESLWHMLGTSLQTLAAATSDTTRRFDSEYGPPAGQGHTGVWFDLFGRAFAVLYLHTLFALTITLIVVPVIIMAVTMYFLYSANKLYYFSNTPLVPQPPDYSNLPHTTQGWRGLLRFPVAFVLATAAAIGMAFLIHKVNPMIAYSSQYTVWAMFLTLWWCVAWFVLRGADANTVRPTALGRGYAFIEQWLLWWVVMVVVAVSIDRAQLASGYWVLVTYTGVFLAAWISVLELVGLPPKNVTALLVSRASSDIGDDHAEEATEETPLFRGLGRPSTFGGYNRGAEEGEEEFQPPSGVFGKEQAWSEDLPTWVWIPQFLLAVPMPLIFTTSVALLLSSAINQTGADGTSMLFFYLLVAVFTTCILLPGSPFYHRISWIVTLSLFAVCIVTLIYNLSAFPFSDLFRLKVYFQQSINLETGKGEAYLVGHSDFVEGIVRDYIPSAFGKEVTSIPDPVRLGLKRTSWDAPPPAVVPGVEPSKWVHVQIFRLSETQIRFVIAPKESRNCKILFESPISDIVIQDRESKSVGQPVPPQGSMEVRLWSRQWDGKWTVNVKGEKEMKGKVVCMWADANDAHVTIPALWEVERFLPRWAVASKLSDGLVEGWWEWAV